MTHQYMEIKIKELEKRIEALEQEPCEDAISRQAVLDKKELIELEDGQSFYCISPEDVETLPPVTPQQKTGHWIETDGKDSSWYMCSECNRRMDDMAAYCPNCGARMAESEDLGDYPDALHNQFDNMTGSMNL